MAVAKGDRVAVADLKPDRQNRRLHTKRNLEMLADGLRRVRAARSIVIDEDNVVLAGNGVAEAASQAGITKVRIIDSDGSELIAVRRSGLSPEEKRQLAMFDNRAPEFSEWDPNQIAHDVSEGLDLTPFFHPNELKQIVKEHTEPVVAEVQTSAVADRFWISIRGPLQHQAATLQRLRQATSELAGVERWSWARRRSCSKSGNRERPIQRNDP
jgi:hypothetical protein